MTPNPATRLFLLFKDITPANSVLSFTDYTGVANYYGTASAEAKMATEFFVNPGTMEFTRIGLGQRPHLIGANLANLTLAQLQAISGSLSLTFDGFTYSGSVNLANITSFADAATDIRKALHHPPIVATTSNDTITAQTISFTGFANYAQVVVTSGHLLVGGKISGPGVVATDPSATNTQVIYNHPPINGNEHDSTFAWAGAMTQPAPLTETYGVLHIGSSIGIIAPGDRLIGPGIPDLTAIISDLGNGNWLINNALTTSGNFTITAPTLDVTPNLIKGYTEDHNFFEISPDGAFGFDAAPSDLSFATGTAADALGLSAASGAADSSPGGQHPTMAQFLNQVVRKTGGDFGEFQAEGTRFANSFTLWQSKHPEYEYLSTFTETTPPAGLYSPSEAFALINPGPAFETCTGRNLFAPIVPTLTSGHGPGAST